MLSLPLWDSVDSFLAGFGLTTLSLPVCKVFAFVSLDSCAAHQTVVASSGATPTSTQKWRGGRGRGAHKAHLDLALH